MSVWSCFGKLHYLSIAVCQIITLLPWQMDGQFKWWLTRNPTINTATREHLKWLSSQGDKSQSKALQMSFIHRSDCSTRPGDSNSVQRHREEHHHPITDQQLRLQIAKPSHKMSQHRHMFIILLILVIDRIHCENSTATTINGKHRELGCACRPFRP